MDSLICQNVRTHNLKNLNLSLPLQKWIAITGVSGSGKSSLAFDTIYADAQRRFLETLGTYERQFLQGLPQGECDSIENIPAAIALKQSNKTGDPRSTIATAADLADPLRTLFSSLMDPSCAQCGHPVTNHQPEDLVKLICDQKKGVFVLSAPLAMDLTKQRKSKIQQLQMEGFSWVLVQGELISLEELFNRKDLKQVELVFDRIDCQTPSEEVENRVETLWSQVRYSSDYSFVHASPLLQRNVSENSSCFYVQTYCHHCQKPTNSIQSSDLNWNSVLGSCSGCQGFGHVPVLDSSKIIPNVQLSIEQGAIKPWTTETFDWMQKNLLKSCHQRNIPTNVPYENLSAEDKAWIWDAPLPKGASAQDFISLNEFFKTLEQERYKSTSRILLSKYRTYVECPSCHGARVGPVGRNAVCHGKHYQDLFLSEVHETYAWVKSLALTPRFAKKLEKISEIYQEVEHKISLLVQLGLGSAQLFRKCKTLSGGEYQRVLLSRVIGNGLTDALYVLDEPSIGLGKEEIPALIQSIRSLRDLGNTVLMVEHDKSLILAADEIIEIGPCGGEKGGYLLPIEQGQLPKSLLSSMAKNPPVRRSISVDKRIWKKEKSLFLKGFSALNCQSLQIELAVGKLNVISGPSGSGKSTLLRYGLEAALETAAERQITFNQKSSLEEGIGTWEEFSCPSGFLESTDLLFVEQKAMHRTITSVPATVLGLMDLLRKHFALTAAAKANGFTASDFSFNGKGGCENCKGKGQIQEDLFFLGQVDKVCPVCDGARFRSDVLHVHWQGKNIHQWLGTSLKEVKDLLGSVSGFNASLGIACQLGLGHVPLGLSTSCLSGGEAQRLRMASTLAKSQNKMCCLLDEPTRGLSEMDVGNLVETLLGLCQEGHTFVVVEHHHLFEQYADHLIYLGPEGGAKGGRVMAREASIGL